MSDRVFRILLMIDDAFVGGGQKHVLWLAQYMDRREFTVAVACEREGFLVDEFAKLNVRHYPLSMSNIPNPIALLRCRGVLHNFRPDVVHTHGGTAGATGRIAARMFSRAKIVHTYHGLHYVHDPRRLRRSVFRSLESSLLRITDQTICVAQQDVETGLREGIVDPGKVVIIRNGIDTTPYEIERKNEVSGRPVIGTIGRLHTQKGHRHLLAAAADLKKSFPAVEFLIIGDGELRGELEAQAAALELGENVTFAGTRTDIPVQLGRMSVFVLPSLWEGFPIVLLEAMAAGLPIVATGVDGVKELLRDGESALLVPPGDPIALQKGIERLLRDPGLGKRLAEKARQTVREQFSVERMVRETENVYRSLFK